MKRLTVESVEPFPLAENELHGFQLEVPKSGEAWSSQTLHFDGWTLGKDSPVKAVEVLQDGRPLSRIPVREPRPDLAEAFPDVAAAASGGFSGAIGGLRLRRRFELLIRGELENGVTMPLATIGGRREPMQLAPVEGPRPLIVTTLGRTGSTWCVWMLQSHPEIVAHSPFENDARVGTYWMSVLQTLSDPTSYLRQVYPGDAIDKDWWAGHEADIPSRLSDAVLSGWLADSRIFELAEACRERIETFYEFLAEQQGKRANFFVEKFLPRQVPADLLRELYPGAAEVVLVRDLRDVFCSVLAFNRKRGYDAFGREDVSGDDEYIDTVRRSGEALLQHMNEEGRETHLLRYEDLIREPEATLGPLLEFVGLDPAGAPAMVERASVSTGGMDHHMTAPSAAASIGRWRKDLDPQLADRCDAILSPVGADFGYATAEGDPTSSA
ncbi:MAG TPA: sulfotransferase [Solirubrobacterales bacterium]|nr:sulfotransferase [Solirubrobacterales bacterium]